MVMVHTRVSSLTNELKVPLGNGRSPLMADGYCVYWQEPLISDLSEEWLVVFYKDSENSQKFFKFGLIGTSFRMPLKFKMTSMTKYSSPCHRHTCSVEPNFSWLLGPAKICGPLANTSTFSIPWLLA